MPPRLRVRCTQPPRLTLAPTSEGLSSPPRCVRLAVAKREVEAVEVSAGACGSNKPSRGVKFSSCIDLVEGASRSALRPAGQLFPRMANKQNLLDILPSEA